MSRSPERPGTALRSFLIDGLVRMVGAALAVALPGPTALQAERLPIQTYNASNGLAHDRVRCVLA